MVDVGAHSGGWTRSAMAFYPEAKYSLFEPQRSLLENQRDLDLPNVRKHYVGAGPRTEAALLTRHSRSDSWSYRLTPTEAKDRGFSQEESSVVSLDDFFANSEWPAPDVLKIGAEGWDLEVLSGATTTAAACEVVLVEAGVMNKSFGNTVLAVLEFMKRLGFTLFDVTDLNRTPTFGALWNVEVAFVKSGGLLDRGVSSYS